VGVERVTPAELHRLHPDAVYIQSEVPAGANGDWGWVWSDDKCYGFAARWKGRVGWLTVDGPRQKAADLFCAVLAELPTRPAGFTLPRGDERLLPAALRADGVDHWDFRWTRSAPPRQEQEQLVSVESSPDDKELAAFLAEASPSHSVEPGDPKIRRWVSIRDADRQLLAIGADTRRPSTGVAHLASVATRQTARGRGLGAAITAWLTRQIFAEGAGLVTLGMYSDNAVAQRLYTRLGFAPGVRYSSGRLARAASVAGGHGAGRRPF
jgi:ribosomal protein S18 acetylase RimI-like enzyme